MSTWIFSDHAKRRRKEMGLTEHAVEAVLSAPVIDVPSYGKHKDKGCRMAFGEALVVVYNVEQRTVVTVLVRSDDCYLERERDASEMAKRLAQRPSTCHTGSR